MWMGKCRGLRKTDSGGTISESTQSTSSLVPLLVGQALINTHRWLHRSMEPRTWVIKSHCPSALHFIVSLCFVLFWASKLNFLASLILHVYQSSLNRGLALVPTVSTRWWDCRWSYLPWIFLRSKLKAVESHTCKACQYQFTNRTWIGFFQQQTSVHQRTSQVIAWEGRYRPLHHQSVL